MWKIITMRNLAQGLSAMVMSSSRMGTLDRLMPGQYMAAPVPKVNADDQVEQLSMEAA